MSAAAGDPEETTKVAPKSNKEALEFACDGYAGSLSISPAARRKVEEVRAASPKSLCTLHAIHAQHVYLMP
jgi:hypothetical protein